MIKTTQGVINEARRIIRRLDIAKQDNIELIALAGLVKILAEQVQELEANAK